MRCAMLLLLLGLAACGPGGIQPGGRYSGVPDTSVGNWATPSGGITTDGRIYLNRERPPQSW
ncbi:hypothetical protein JYK14_06200 [Siccirubricoccus sp. KC 17139]|uniref:Uncharacterized protein n=1 Tax=Siccirubricoccus soli TaxID=2899147 RepID=A0ABT1D1J0_9PROT|nr:hypothetical protein [Siccirubricoccus soli]MCO6415771.1 hypothetical protein [Siccirubricoccus soli]MCP2681903.1 hypothetical protein [Siccirubricoccus soli]